uniref:Uncharacterized protein n=1 Tax=Megaselia scalaris TaxID=36166 RepID=T1GXM4_MEGSC
MNLNIQGSIEAKFIHLMKPQRESGWRDHEYDKDVAEKDKLYRQRPGPQRKLKDRKMRKVVKLAK